MLKATVWPRLPGPVGCVPRGRDPKAYAGHKAQPSFSRAPVQLHCQRPGLRRAGGWVYHTSRWQGPRFRRTFRRRFHSASKRFAGRQEKAGHSRPQCGPSQMPGNTLKKTNWKNYEGGIAGKQTARRPADKRRRQSCCIGPSSRLGAQGGIVQAGEFKYAR